MLTKMNVLGKKMTSKEMKEMKGGALPGGGKCVGLGGACAGGGCVPGSEGPVCCSGYVCTGSDGIVYNPGVCIVPGTTPPGGGEEM